MQQITMKILAVAGLLAFALSVAHAAELIMVEEEGCVYCARFDREIAPAYPKTPQGRLAPLRRLPLNGAWPEDLQQVRRAQVTPTFILVDEGQEVDRLIGYPGDQHFWYLLDKLLEKL